MERHLEQSALYIFKLGTIPQPSFTAMKGDYYRYLAEFKSGNEKKEVADKSLEAYQLRSLPGSKDSFDDDKIVVAKATTRHNDSFDDDNERQI
ncbi:hypothetical protein Dimus_026989 [Dionaea muscipula]